MGKPVTSFRVATSEQWKDKEGNPKERTEWHRVVTYRKNAEICSEHLRKGRHVYIEGSIHTKSWTDKEGNMHNSTDIEAKAVKFLDSKEETKVES